MQSKNDKKNLCKGNLQPDRELIAWERWIQIRKEEINHLSKKTGRIPVDLTMNLLEEVREDKERKIVLEYAQIERKPSLRSTLWEQPNRLKQHCYSEPVYEVQRTRAEIGRPKIIEHIGVPQYVKEAEKGLTGISQKHPCSQLDAKYIDYRIKREEELQKNIKKIDPHRPQMSQLIVIGKKPKQIKKSTLIIPTIEISVDKSYIENTPDSIYAIQINKTIFFKETFGQDLACLKKMQSESWHEVCTSWSYYFNSPVNRPGRAKLTLKNLGTVTLRYCWKKIYAPIQFIPESLYEQVFFFNKNESIIYPGQLKEIHILFVSDKLNTYNESWEISFLNAPSLHLLYGKLTVNFTADSKESSDVIHKKVNKLKTAITMSTLKLIARNILEEIITKAVSVEHQIYPYKHLFLKCELFEMKNPICFYHQTDVCKLRELYTEMVPGELWDLSITSWRKAMINMEYEERMMYYENLRNIHRNLIRPWYEGEDLLKQKYRAVNILLSQLADKFYDEYSKLRTSTTNSNITNIGTITPRMSNIRKPSLNYDNATFEYFRNVCYIRIYDHVAKTIEMCAGVLQSLDLNRWIHFDFCRN